MYSDSEKQTETSLHEFPNPTGIADAMETPSISSIPEALRVFRSVAGYDLKFLRPEARKSESAEQGNSADDVSPFDKTASFLVGEEGRRVYGALRLARDRDVYPRVDWDAAEELAALLASMLTENCRWRDELIRREGELAAMTVGAFDDGAPHGDVSARLTGILRSGAAALGGFSAAMLCLLDDTTSTLRTHAVWGLPDDRRLEPPRPLRGARAELEALMGSAVTINDDYLAAEWMTPENFPCSVCIPIISETTILGVAWFFSEERHETGSRELETLNLVAWRLVDELEKEAARLKNSSKKSETGEKEEHNLNQWVDRILGEGNVAKD